MVLSRYTPNTWRLAEMGQHGMHNTCTAHSTHSIHCTPNTRYTQNFSCNCATACSPLRPCFAPRHTAAHCNFVSPPSKLDIHPPTPHQAIQSTGSKVYLFGGFVRDTIGSRAANDIDLSFATDGQVSVPPALLFPPPVVGPRRVPPVQYTIYGQVPTSRCSALWVLTS